MTELPKENLDLILLANLQQNRVNSAHTQQTSTHKEEKDRQWASVKLFLHGIQVWKATYLFAHGVGNTWYRNICKHYDSHGFTPIRHSITRRCAANALSLNDERHVINFITTFADCNAMSLPGRMPKMKDYTVMMLSNDVTKANLWRTYLEHVEIYLPRLLGSPNSRTFGSYTYLIMP